MVILVPVLLTLVLTTISLYCSQVPKKSQFSLKRQKTKAEVEFGDLVCPLESCPISVVDISTGDRGVGDGVSY